MNPILPVRLFRAAATPDTIFRIASQTKALVSVAAMVLQEEGRLLLSHPVGRYIPELQKTTVAVAKEGGYDVVDAKRPITLRDLLTHTAGVSYASGPAKDKWLAAGFPDWYFAERDEPMGAMAVFATREAAEEFMAGDPFLAHGVVGRRQVREWDA